MIEAELHHKIEQSEDILTSSVFGMLKYDFMKDALIEFLGKAKHYFVNDLSFDDEIREHDILKGNTIILFWKFFTVYQSVPDLIIKGDNFAIIVEVKDKSELSGDDQLIKYYQVIENDYKDKNFKYLIYLTRSIGIPELPIETIDALRDKNFYWLSWYELYQILKNNSERSCVYEVCEDLKKLLECRCLVLFEGFGDCPKIDFGDSQIFWKEDMLIFSDYSNVNIKNPIFWQGGKNE